MTQLLYRIINTIKKHENLMQYIFIDYCFPLLFSHGIFSDIL